LQDGWRIEDISELLLIILQLSTTEICYNDTDIGIIINEYIEITKIFGNVKEAKFVNNILQQVANQYRDE
jgi:transcription termination factor NusB